MGKEGKTMFRRFVTLGESPVSDNVHMGSKYSLVGYSWMNLHTFLSKRNDFTKLFELFRLNLIVNYINNSR